MAAQRGFYLRYGKRMLDGLLAATLLLVLAPLLLGVYVLVCVRLGRPALFTQNRPGLNGKVFRLFKFRTMTDARDAAGNLLPDDVRLTSFGRWLRSTSLDELPELWNILKGEMSFVGPRPLLTQYLPLYSPAQARRHEVRPGLTGWAQVHGRNATTWEDRFAHDVWYVDHASLGLDAAILLKTALAVVKRDGISAEGCATMPAFAGEGPCEERRAA